jgi:hypothetical protein
MMIDFSIRITDENGDPVEGAEVLVHYPWAMDSARTDSDGYVRFHKSQAFGDAALTTIYVNGALLDGDIWIEDGSFFSYSI